MLLVDVGIWDAIGLTPDRVRIVDFEYQLHGTKAVLRGAALHRRTMQYAARKCGNLVVPRGVTIVAGDLLLRVAMIIVRICAHDGQGLGTVTLGPGENSAEDKTTPRKIDIQMESMPPLRRRRI